MITRRSYFLLACGALSLFGHGCARREMISGPLPQQIYVWQRVWSEPVNDAIAEARSSVAGFAVLAAEIDLRQGSPKIFRPNINYGALKSTGVPIALAIRVDPFVGPFRENDAVAQAIVRQARDEIETARAHAIEPSELQIDFDCGEWKLDGYRTWLQQIRAAVAPLPVTPTMLPSWLKHREFRRLARECGRFILQVHSVGVPQKLSDTQRLTDARQTNDWVNQSAQLGVPFRVSLPTYSYLVAFAPDGKFSGLSAEGPSAHWPANAKLIRWEAQPAELAELIQQWTRARPALLRGVCWYRLPVASDNLNWSWKTLAAVMAGRAPVSNLRAVASSAQPNEILLRNEGERDEPLPQSIVATWSDARLIAADALEGYTYRQGAAGHALTFQLLPAGEVLRLPPGAQRSVGWMRFESASAIQVSIAPAPALPAAPDPPGPRDRH